MGKTAAMGWVQTNVADARQANALASSAVLGRLAACANTWAVESVYWWDGKVQREREVTVHLKTAPGRLRLLVAHVRRAHPYEVPYLEWGTTDRVDKAYAAWLKREAAARPPGTRRRT